MKPVLSVVMFALGGLLTAADEVPAWVLQGIAGVETASFYSPDGSFHYTNHKRGRHGELGPWQMRKVAFREVRQKGDRFERLAEEPAYAEKLAARYLLRINAQVGGNWDRTVRAYNVGVTGSRRANRGRDYLEDVRAWARRVGALPVRE